MNKNKAEEQLDVKAINHSSPTLENLLNERIVRLLHLTSVEAELTRAVRMLAHSNEDIPSSLCEELQDQLNSLRSEESLSSHLTRVESVNSTESILIARLNFLVNKLVSIVG